MPFMNRDELQVNQTVGFKPSVEPMEDSMGPGMFGDNETTLAEGATAMSNSLQREWWLARGVNMVAGHGIEAEMFGEINVARDRQNNSKHPYPTFEPVADERYFSLSEEWRGLALGATSAAEMDAIFKGYSRTQNERASDAKTGAWMFGGAMVGNTVNPGGIAGLAARSMKGVKIATALTGVDELVLQSFDVDRTISESIAVTAMSGVIDTGLVKMFDALNGRTAANGVGSNAKMAQDWEKAWSAQEGRVARVMDDAEVSQKYDELVSAREAAQAAGNQPEVRRINREFNEFVQDRFGGNKIGGGSPDSDGGNSLLADNAAARFVNSIPDGPVKRTLQDGSVKGKKIIDRLVEQPFFMKKHAQGEASAMGIDRKVAVRWVAPMVDAMKETEKLYKLYRERIGQTKAFESPTLQSIKDTVQGGRKEGVLSYTEFSADVTRAKRRLHNRAGELDDFDQEVVTAARYWHEKIYSKMGEKAKGLEMFSMEARSGLKQAQQGLTEAENFNNTADIARLSAEVAEWEAKVADLNNIDLSSSYVNRIYRHDYLNKNRSRFARILIDHGASEQEATATIETILRERSLTADENAMGFSADIVGKAHALKGRALEIPDELIEDFLENDINTLGRYYTTRMGTDVELMDEFGSINLYKEMDDIAKDYADKIRNAPAGETRTRLKQRMEQEIEDVRVMRDRLRGTYGQAEDPDGWTNRSIRLVKMYNAMTMLTGAMAAVPDLGNMIIFDGMARSFGASFEQLRIGMKGIKLAKAEANLAGEALDMYMSMRAALFSDLDDALGATTGFEKLSSQATQLSFNVNLMNQWNVGVKTMASLITGSRIIEMSGRWSRGAKLSEREILKLTRAGINRDMATRIAHEFAQEGETLGKYTLIAKSAKWGDKEAAEAFQAALGGDINRIIVTPGKGELPNFMGGGFETLQKGRKTARQEKVAAGESLNALETVEDMFMSPQMTSMILQFQTFGVSATNKVIAPAIQAPDRNFLIGSASLVALGAMINQIRNEQMDRDQTPAQFLRSAVDRSNVAGYYFNNIYSSLETLARGDVGQLGGPAVQQLGNVSDALFDPSAENTRRLVVGNRYFWADGVSDRLQSMAEGQP